VLSFFETYEEGSGQKLNFQKTAVFFSRNTSVGKRLEILNLSRLSEATRYDTYLGLPSLIGKSKMQAFNSINSRVEKKLSNWKVKFLSQARREILLKDVVQAITTYCMSVFLLPQTLCKDLNRMMQDFLWSHMAKSSKIRWMSWEKMGKAKSMGGLRFRDLSIFIKALLAKQLWRFQQNPDSLVAQIYKAKYFPRSTILEATIGNKPSYAWRSILATSELLREGLVWRVGNGLSIPIWGARWLPTPTFFSVQTAPRILLLNSTVSCLIDSDTKWWNLDLVSAIFNEEEARVISNITLSSALPPDRLVWQGTSNGLFSVRNAYHLGKEFHQRSLGACSNSSKEVG